MHKIKSTIYVIILVGILIAIGLIIRHEAGISGATSVNMIACYEDKDCNDRIDATKDICYNPGTVSALCVNRADK
ncbi:MAG: hypothetical protein AABX04_04290 [Nanoarchaeota archaeon]|mgnify:CR=1